jgi:hypothetical protein
MEIVVLLLSLDFLVLRGEGKRRGEARVRGERERQIRLRVLERGGESAYLQCVSRDEARITKTTRGRGRRECLYGQGKRQGKTTTTFTAASPPQPLLLPLPPPTPMPHRL